MDTYYHARPEAQATQLHDTKFITPSSAHRDGGPFSLSLDSLVAQGVHLEKEACCIAGRT